MQVSCVVLTRGDRPAELERCLRGVRAQRDVTTQIVLVGNGAPVQSGVEADVVVESSENLGIPEGRNRGAGAAAGEIVVFLDDDARPESDNLFAGVRNAFDDPQVAVVAMRVVDEAGNTQRAHLPRIGERAPDRVAEVTAFLGGACAIRRTAFTELGGLPGPFFYALEETDFAWRALDGGWKILYRPELRVVHPRVEHRGRHPSFYSDTARNRVWLAHRLLPLPLAIVYVVDWFVVTALRSWRTPGDLRAVTRGLRAGLRAPMGPRRPIAWRTVWRLTRLGRPPII